VEATGSIDDALRRCTPSWNATKIQARFRGSILRLRAMRDLEELAQVSLKVKQCLIRLVRKDVSEMSEADYAVIIQKHARGWIRLVRVRRAKARVILRCLRSWHAIVSRVYRPDLWGPAEHRGLLLFDAEGAGGLPCFPWRLQVSQGTLSRRSSQRITLFTASNPTILRIVPPPRPCSQQARASGSPPARAFLRRRGSSLSSREYWALQACLSVDGARQRKLRKDSTPVYFLRLSSLGDLLRAVRSILLGSRRPRLLVPAYQVVLAAMATKVQAWARGQLARRRVELPSLVARHRAVLCIQRWWRFRRGLGLRLAYLKEMCTYLRRIRSEVLFLDVETYYVLAKTNMKLARRVRNNAFVRNVLQERTPPSEFAYFQDSVVYAIPQWVAGRYLDATTRADATWQVRLPARVVMS
jgi:hypothetical protein